MVTAIVIPIICLYFFFLTKKEMRENDRKWLNSGSVNQEAILSGEIKDISEEKQRFYYHRYIYVQSLKLQTETKLITTQKITPVTNHFKKESFQVGDVIRVYGTWDNNKFLFNEYKVEKR
ncbi:hypothetical protein [Neobacillus drentensis]|uniref:hypothetical protein n=1 Tax=Neobacillus drentensis TaxID=220684 RepID=UPI002858F3CB|nr:hypothetical protein [Neobacillus drentensis]MDR7236161.1 DNA helicase TIP49 (TBP-interacting protein) [Neobacillus drentensis]